MSEIENPRWIRRPEVSFELDTIMLVNNNVLEIPDIPEGVIEDVVNASKNAINSHIESEYERAKLVTARAIRPTILIARLAINGREDDVLSEYGLSRMESVNLHTNVSVLNKTYVPYWNEVLKTGYIPEVQTDVLNGISVDLGGTWLGVRRPVR